jgi:HlyD family secretion protein
MILVTDFENTINNYIPKLNNRVYFIYYFLLFIIFTFLILLPILHIDISVKTTGITRPVTERTEVKPSISGIIDTIYFEEGARIQKNEIILRIKDLTTKNKKTLNNFEITQREQFIRDLSTLSLATNFLLLNKTEDEEIIDKNLESSLYKAQFNRFLHLKREQELILSKANNEVEMNTSLAKEKVISTKEFFDIQNNHERILSTYKAFLREQQSNWQQDLIRYRLELSQLQQQLRQLNTDASYYEVKAPLSGILQGINTRYAGGLLQANETLCTISPEVYLIGECFVNTKDVGLLKVGQLAKFQIEAFDYNYFGMLTGKIIAIDNDFTDLNTAPVFKVRCSFDNYQLHLKNGFSAQLKKGLKFQAKFLVARRSLWQLLFDKIDNWLNPSSPLKTSA